jgi:hypothetical protein
LFARKYTYFEGETTNPWGRGGFMKQRQILTEKSPKFELTGSRAVDSE